MRKILPWLAGLLYSGVATTGCADKAAAPAPAPFVDRQGMTEANVTYNNYIGPLINTRCRTCHNPASALSTKPALDAWVNERTYANAARHRVKLVASIVQNTMPIARPLPQPEKELLQAWLERGAPEK